MGIFVGFAKLSLLRPSPITLNGDTKRHAMMIEQDTLTPASHVDNQEAVAPYQDD